eukprot:NODE_7201_length_457_cov_16.139394_g7035_i0.p1 GENE.NODE_7201_length_457_cov_16.139394_g7035_i0~~NODE_7201_length_457_cov_16.139394_g7035_i0.p1  ORF type:complete len:134 (-),score=35.37 NODE_7201_length_457_cov_16.139394_g7035_i0:27-428(-)
MDPELERIGTDIEKLAEEVLTDEQAVIDYDRRRNQNRESIRALQSVNGSQKVWILLENTFVRLPCSAAKQHLAKEQTKLDTEITSTRDQLKFKMDRLATLSNDPDMLKRVRAFSLTALKKDDALHIFERPIMS